MGDEEEETEGEEEERETDFSSMLAVDISEQVPKLPNLTGVPRIFFRGAVTPTRQMAAYRPRSAQIVDQ